MTSILRSLSWQLVVLVSLYFYFVFIYFLPVLCFSHSSQFYFLLDSTIKLWNVTDCTTEQGSCLGVLARHSGIYFYILFYSTLGAILSLKWSPNGQFLGSGSDDCTIVVWHSVDNGPFTAFKILTSHSSDVTDVAWTANVLITCGIDNTLYVFDNERFNQLAKVSLPGVGKGLCIDPIGSFVGCQLENSLVIIRTSDWAIEKTVQKFNQDYSGSFFSRPSWSPDGTLVAASGGYNPVSGSSCWLFQRDAWIVDGCLVGHQGPVECSKFSPLLYAPLRQSSENGPLSLDSSLGIVAMGSQDGSISLWSNVSDTPIVVFWDLFYHSVLDISWSLEGDKFFACSFDGSVVQVSLSFLPNSFQTIPKGKLLSLLNIDREQSISTLPSSVIEGQLKEHAIKSQLIVTPIQPSPSSVVVGEKEKKLDLKALIQNIPSSSSSQGLVSGTSKEMTVESIETLKEQKVERTKEGKRRITPQFIKAIDTVSETVPPTLPSASIRKSIIADCNLSLHSAPSITQLKELEQSDKKIIFDPIKPLSTNISIFQKYDSVSISLTCSNITKNGNNQLIVQHSNLDSSSSNNKNLIWTFSLSSSSISFVDFNKQFLVIVINSYELNILSTLTGRILFPNIILPYDQHRIILTNHYLLFILFTNGEFICWNLQERRVEFKNNIQKYFSLNHKLSLLKVEINTGLIEMYFSENLKLIYDYVNLQMIFNESTNPSTPMLLEPIEQSIEKSKLIFDTNATSIMKESLQEIERKVAGALLIGNYDGYKKYCICYLNLLCSTTTTNSSSLTDLNFNLKINQIINEIVSLFPNQIDQSCLVDLLSIPIYFDRKKKEIEEIFFKLKINL